MKTQSPLFNTIPTIFSSIKISTLSNEKVTNTITDSFNEQTHLNHLFKLKVKKMIDSIEYAYPNEGFKLQGIIDSFLEESKKLSGDYMKKILDTYLAFNPIDIRDRRLGKTLMTPKHNENWMKDWMEQADNYKDNKEAMEIIVNNIEGFLHYADVVEGKFTKAHEKK